MKFITEKMNSADLAFTFLKCALYLSICMVQFANSARAGKKCNSFLNFDTNVHRLN